MFSDYDRRHIADLLRGEGTWFTAHLMRLIDKADDEHRARLALGFSEEVAAYEAWNRGDAPEFDYDEPVDVLGYGRTTVRGKFRRPHVFAGRSVIERNGVEIIVDNARLQKVQS